MTPTQKLSSDQAIKRSSDQAIKRSSDQAMRLPISQMSTKIRTAACECDIQILYLGSKIMKNTDAPAAITNTCAEWFRNRERMATNRSLEQKTSILLCRLCCLTDSI
ncbi:unnamed protein product [Albugo candida]|uniref:Uncharacterized protein n=1 Tax=Albugo candida TaxID=65357 RepID=A0A024GNM6_9STRA|nr:unnamed protein product [Albugo candida]|eukprot:CCI48479.1 unnamed protein product [Albugo candida]